MGLLLGLVAWWQPSVYQSDLRLLVSFRAATDQGAGPPGMVTADSDAARRLTESRVRSYTQKAASPAVTRAVVAALRLPESPDEIGAEIAASTPLDTTYIDISVRDRNRRRAVLIGNAVAAELIRLANAEKPPPAPAAPLGISIAVPPSVPDRPVPRFWPGYVAGGLAGGFAIGVGLATLRIERNAGLSAGNRRRTIAQGPG
jgi:hypothetical protein